MSIASSLTALASAKAAIRQAITDMGGTVASGDGFTDFAAAIATIPTSSGPDVAMDSGTFTPTTTIDINMQHGPEVSHSLGVVPQFIIAWADPSQWASSRGQLLYTVSCTLSSSTRSHTTGYYDNNFMYSSTSAVSITEVSTSSFAPAAAGTACKWLAGITYHWLAIAI